MTFIYWTFLGKTEQSKHNQNYGFRTRNCPPVMEELTEFEYNLQLMIKNVVFKKVNNSCQTQLSNDVKKIKESDKIFVPADKSRNIYLLSKNDYQKLLTENITKKYKITYRRKKVYDINNETKAIAKQLSIDDRIEQIRERTTYYHQRPQRALPEQNIM